MPCTPVKARHLFKSGKARPKRNKLGLFYVQLTYEQEPNNQSLEAGIDPGAKFEGYSVVGTQDTVLNLMVEAPNHVKDAVEIRRTMHRARRQRKWRWPKRFDNRLNRKQRIPPSTRSCWEAKARIIVQLKKVLPLTAVVVEDVQAITRKGKGGKWNAAFSRVQVGKEHLYRGLREMGLVVHTREGWQTKELREKYDLTKTKSKSQQSFASHAVDAWCLAASVSGAKQPTCTRLWYMVPARIHRHQLHRLQASRGGERKPYGSTRSLGLKRGTLVRHPKYGLCAVGGFDRKKKTISLHDYRTNRRLTQGARVKDCRILTCVAFRSFLVAKGTPKKSGKGDYPIPAPKQGMPVSSHRVIAGGSSQAGVLMNQRTVQRAPNEILIDGIPHTLIHEEADDAACA
jgi:RRXRR protein